MKDVLIEIKGTQQYPDREPDVSTFTTMGQFSVDEKVIKLIYKESEMIGAKDVTSEITIEGDTVTLARRGVMESRLTIAKGRRYSCLYNTPEGDFVIGIYGESLLTEFTQNSAKIHMSYTIDVYSGLLSKNIMEIKIKEI